MKQSEEMWGQAENAREARGSRGRKARRALVAVLLALCLALGVAGGAALYAANGLAPAASSGEDVKLTVPKGSSSAQIADILERHGVIRDAFLFRLYVRYKHEGQQFQAGEYAFRPGMTLDEVIAKLNAGDVVQPDMERITVPEGFTVKQIADQLAAAHEADEKAFLDLASHPGQFDAYSVVYIPKDADLKYPLEGYLFPETYELEQGSSEKAIINRMLLETDKKLDELPADWKDQLKRLHLTVHQMLTVASLVEREVVVDEERPIVAGVIYNRLAKGMNLQIDATVQYALGEQKDRLLDKDLQVESPYNTYLHKGLPPGPIASPSLASIKAALYPAQTDYYFYVTKKDGTHSHLFAKTYQEHLRNIEKSNRTAKAAG